MTAWHLFRMTITGLSLKSFWRKRYNERKQMDADPDRYNQN